MWYNNILDISYALKIWGIRIVIILVYLEKKARKSQFDVDVYLLSFTTKNVWVYLWWRLKQWLGCQVGIFNTNYLVGLKMINVGESSHLVYKLIWF